MERSVRLAHLRHIIETRRINSQEVGMSFLYPLFLAGITAISLPIILHLIRRHTRKRVTFSSLMFLRTTVPRFKNRSRLENLPLLILRCIIFA